MLEARADSTVMCRADSTVSLRPGQTPMTMLVDFAQFSHTTIHYTLASSLDPRVLWCSGWIIIMKM